MRKHILTVTLVACALAAPLHAQRVRESWPGLWGPGRNGSVAGPKAPTALKEVWRRPSAGGYSEMASTGDRVFTLELKDAVDYAVALDAQSGREVWRTRIGETYRGHDGSHDGPISTPAIDGGELFALGPNGHLIAINAADGKERWRHDLVKEYGVSPPSYGFATSPLIEGDLVIVQVGGEKAGGLLAFARGTGARVWHAAHAKGPAYSSAVAATIAGKRQILAASDRVFAVDPADGSLLWSVAGAAGGEEVNNSPLVLPDNRVLLSFWGEAVMLKVAREGDAFMASEVWRGPRIRNTHGPAIYKDGYLYGFAGPIMVCVDAATGEIKWRQRTYEGSLVGYGDHLLMLGQSSGELAVLRASPQGYSEVTRTRVFNPGATSITGPAPSGARVFLRNVEEIVALRVEGGA